MGSKRADHLVWHVMLSVTVFAILFLGYAVSEGRAAAQESGPTVDRAALHLWPEYDDPGLLVIFSGDFDGATKLPLRVAFPLPAGARGIQVTAADPAAGLLSQPWNLVGTTLTYTLPLPSFQTEYYVDLPLSGNRRDITYTFTAPYPIRLLAIEIQQPARATDFSISPQAEGSGPGTDGLTSYTLTRRNVNTGEKLDFRIRYSKADTGLSKPAKPSLALPASTPAEATSAFASNWLGWALVGVGLVALVIVGIYWMLRIRSRDSVPGARRGRQGAPGAKPQSYAEGAGAPATHCTQCGRRLGPSDRFCAACGAPRRE